MRDYGPDLICIGSQMAGTGSLYDILGGHTDCCMPPITELGLSIRDDPASTTHPPMRNKKALVATPMRPDFEAFARDLLAEEYDRLADQFEGRALEWRNRFRGSA